MRIQRTYGASENALPGGEPSLHPGNKREQHLVPFTAAGSVGCGAAAQFVLRYVQPKNEVDQPDPPLLQRLQVKLALPVEQGAAEGARSPQRPRKIKVKR